MGTMDPPNISMPEGGEKRRKPSSLSPKIVESDRSTSGPYKEVVDGLITADGFPDLANLGDMNENGTKDEMYWYAMGQEEVQDQMNDYDELDICR